MSLSVDREEDNADLFSAYFDARFRKLIAQRNNNARALYSTNPENVS